MSLNNKLSKSEIPMPQEYVKRLIEESKNTPTVFVYFGFDNNLTQEQKHEFKKLHERAKQEKGNVYVIDGSYLDRQMQEYHYIFLDLKEELEKCKAMGRGKSTKRMFSGINAKLIDMNRAVVLNNTNTLIAELKKEYQVGDDTKGFLYHDFDVSFDNKNFS